MALIVKMTQDVRRYETKQLGPFTLRQGIFLIIAVIIAVPFLIFIPGSYDMKILTAAIFAGPIAVCGFAKPDHTPMEIWVIRFIYRLFLTPRKRFKRNPASVRARRKSSKEVKPKYSLKPEMKIYT